MGYEISEVHSMSLEYFSWPWQKLFFDDVEKFRLVSLAEDILFVPYGLLIDEFQHKVYGNPYITSLERKKIWRGRRKILSPPE